MRLSELNPTFLKWIDDHNFEMVESIVGADGIKFLCPVCFQNNGGSVGTHSIVCWAPHVPQTTYPIPGRWNLVGSNYEDLSLVAGSSSVHLQGPGCGAHFLVQNGTISNC